jgi:WD repeat-containing protein 44
MGGKKRDDATEIHDTVSEISDNRSAGIDAEVFSQPLGYIPRFAAPPKYIKVKAVNRKTRDFDRLFLAQILQDGTARSRKTSIDSKIHDIADAPHPDAPAVAKSASNATWAMEFSRDGRYLAAAGQDKKLRVWEVIGTNEDRDGDHQGPEDEVKLNAPVFKSKLIREYDGHTSSILDLSWSKNNFLLSSSMDKTVRLYHVSRVECLCAFKHNDFVTSIQFHPRDDRFFLAGSLDSKIRLWSIPDKTVAYWQQVPDMVTAVAFTPDGKTSVAGCLNGMCILYDTEGLKAHSQIHVKSNRGRNSKGSKITGIDTIAIPRENGLSDVKLLITSNDSRIRMYNLRDRNLEIKFRGNENSCSQIHASFSDDGKFVICGSEDRKVYVWPTNPSEKPEGDKWPMEVFEAHGSIVTSAVLVPTSTRRLLAKSGDPLFDLCNPPPVTLMSRTDSVISSQAPSEDKDPNVKSRNSESPKRAPETPAYLNRHSHVGGHIIVSADYTGEIKIFRQDCAYQKRRLESWDGGSTFSKKMLGRSGSVHTRNSVASSLNRQSVTLPSKNQSADRILNWRNSIQINSNGNSGSSAANSLHEVNLNRTLTDRARSSSPGTASSWRKRLSLRNSPAPTPLLNAPASPDSPTRTTKEAHPSITLQAPDTPDSPDSFHSASNSPTRNRTTSPTTKINTSVPPDINVINSPPPNAAPPDLPLQRESTNMTDLPHSPGDDLYIIGGQSMMAWNVKNSLIPMAQRQPRTPGEMLMNPLSREGSIVSQLSSEIMSSEGDGGDMSRRASVQQDAMRSRSRDDGTGRDARDAGRERNRSAHLWSSTRASSGNNRAMSANEGRRRSRIGSAVDTIAGVGSGSVSKARRDSEADAEDLKCASCGSTTFTAAMVKGKQRLKCKRCGSVV